MPADRPLSTLEILNLLEKSNCRECGVPTCMAFAALVYQGQRSISDCPRLAPETAERIQGRLPKQDRAEDMGQEVLAKMQARFKDGFGGLGDRAEKLGGWMRNGRLAFHCLGKLFELDSKGDLHSECHQNPWLYVPLLSYVLDSAAEEPTGEWVRFEELKGVSAWVRFFEHSCHKPILELTAEDPDLILDILQLFSAEENLEGFEADSTFLLRPLPKVPFLFTYQPPEDDFPASVSVLLDRTAEVNLDPESLFRLGRGMAQMFRKIAVRHGMGEWPKL
jgi:hypothetical protein